MITTKDQLKEVTTYEENMYCKYMFPTRRRQFMAHIKAEPVYLIMKWQRLSRFTDYYYSESHKPGASLYSKLAYLYYISKRNRWTRKLGLEIGTENIGKGLLIYHSAGGIVVNGSSVIGKNCHLHGNNCIGNSGPEDNLCPVIGDDVMLGVGAKVIGNVCVANKVKIAAGAVVVKDVLEEGCTVAGVPAKIVKHV